MISDMYIHVYKVRIHTVIPVVIDTPKDDACDLEHIKRMESLKKDHVSNTSVFVGSRRTSSINRDRIDFPATSIMFWPNKMARRLLAVESIPLLTDDRVVADGSLQSLHRNTL